MLQQSFEDSKKKPESVGPCGGQGGSRWDDGAYTGVRQLVIAHGSGIDSIQIEYDKDGRSVWSEKHGGVGGSKIDKVKLGYPDEFLTSVEGQYGSIIVFGPVFVRSLTFVSNKRTYGPFGVEEGTCFSLPMAKGKIVGFHGKSGWFLDSIGVYFKPIQPETAPKLLARSPNFVANGQSYVSNGKDGIGYSVIQGSVGESFDIVLAVRQKDGYGNPPSSKINSPPSNKVISRQTSSSSSSSDGSSDESTKDKKQIIKQIPTKGEGIVTYGPWGGSGGAMFDDGVYTGIRQINLSRNVCIVSLKVCYDLDGKSIWGSKHGGTGGFKKEMIVFDYPSEVLTHIKVTSGPLMYMGPNVIKSLTFHTNKGKHGPYGDEQGPSFMNKIEEGKIIGFHGREGLFLDAIGVFVKEGKITLPKPPPYDAIVPHEGHVAQIENSPWSNKLVLAKRGPYEEISCGVVKEPAPCGPGPWGGNGGKPWDDGVFSGIKQIFVTRGEAICSIQLEYDRNGQSVWSVKHGGTGGLATHRVKLDYPHEVLTCVSGYHGPTGKEERSNVIKSITFYTSRGKYGPFGEEIGTFFTSTTTEGKVVGFHGRSSLYLDAIGVHMQHWLGNCKKTTRSSVFKFF